MVSIGPWEWKEESARAVSSLSAITTAATSAGLIEVARESVNATSIIVYNVSSTPNADAVPEGRLNELERSVEKLSARVTESSPPDRRSPVQRCK
jgi:hypothetical protein